MVSSSYKIVTQSKRFGVQTHLACGSRRGRSCLLLLAHWWLWGGSEAPQAQEFLQDTAAPKHHIQDGTGEIKQKERSVPL